MKLRVLIAAVAAAVLASCGQDPTPEGTGASGGVSASQPPAESAREKADAPREEKSEVATAQPSGKEGEEKNEELEKKEGEKKVD